MHFSDPCVYINLEFKGGDLSVIPSLGFSACKAECQRLKGCSFFSINKVACILKDSNVEIHRKNGVISGATDTTCGKLKWSISSGDGSQLMKWRFEKMTQFLNLQLKFCNTKQKSTMTKKTRATRKTKSMANFASLVSNGRRI